MYHFEDSIQIKNTLGMQITVHTVLLLKTKKKVSKEFYSQLEIWHTSYHH